MELAKYIDHTLLRADATEAEVVALAEEAVRWGFAAVCVNPARVEAAVSAVRGTDVGVCSVVGFPLGAATGDAKAFETEDALRRGATEIDMVIGIGAAREGRWGVVTDEIRRIKALAGERIVKVIVEAAFFDEAAKVRLCRCVEEGGADYIKTSTGFGPGGATLEDVRLFAANLACGTRIKAAGGIRTAEQARAFVDAGCARIGTSAGVRIAEAQVCGDA